MNEAYYTAAIKYERPFKPENWSTHTWKQTNRTEYINTSASCFSGEYVKELLYCEPFKDVMKILGKPFTKYFEQWRILLHSLAKEIWQEVLDNTSDPEDDRNDFNHNEEGFIKAME